MNYRSLRIALSLAAIVCGLAVPDFGQRVSMNGAIPQLDESGELPLEALNRDVRYQLTPVGAPGPNLYIAEEVTNNQFKIAGGKPGSKVSWQVTGIRHDAYADAHRIQTEVEKPPQDQGHYLHPELFGAAPKQAVGYAVH